MELRKAIADHLYQFRGIGVSPEQIIIGAGTEYLYGLLIQLFGNKAVYAIEDPGYQKIAQIYTSHGWTYAIYRWMRTEYVRRCLKLPGQISFICRLPIIFRREE